MRGACWSHAIHTIPKGEKGVKLCLLALLPSACTKWPNGVDLLVIIGSRVQDCLLHVHSMQGVLGTLMNLGDAIY